MHTNSKPRVIGSDSHNRVHDPKVTSMKTQQMRAVADGADIEAETLRVMTYNVLAQCYVRSSYFPYCKPSELKWKNRSKNLKKVFVSSLPVSPDVICLQECDEYDKFWTSAMAGLGYEGLFVKKTGTQRDGVAVFWKASKFQEIERNPVELDAPNGDESDVDHELLSRAERGSVGVIVHLKNLQSQTELVIATTHLFWDPMQEDVKLLQTRRMLRSLETFTSTLDASIPTMFVGDFNSLPDSKVYKFITDSNTFSSAYSRYNPDGDGEPDFTNVNGAAENSSKPRFVGTLDYIFYKATRLQPVALMEIMSLKDASREVALPSTISPSDHLPLLCEFRIKSN